MDSVCPLLGLQHFLLANMGEHRSMASPWPSTKAFNAFGSRAVAATLSPRLRAASCSEIYLRTASISVASRRLY